MQPGYGYGQQPQQQGMQGYGYGQPQGGYGNVAYNNNAPAEEFAW